MNDLKAGDILGFCGYNHISDIINIGTLGLPRFSISHVGILGEYKGELVLFESTTLDNLPCLIQGKLFKGTQAHHIDERVKSYHGKVWHYALTRPLYDFEKDRLNSFLLGTIGIPYDQIGAFRASDHWSWIEQWFHEENLSSIFCSEWCAAAHNDIGIFSTSDASRWSPNRLIRAERWHGLLHRPKPMLAE